METEMVLDWLTKSTTIEEVENDHLDDNGVPFGHSHKKWLELKGKMREGDEIWYFNSPDSTWANLCGRAGLCIVRNGQIVDSLVLMMN